MHHGLQEIRTFMIKHEEAALQSRWSRYRWTIFSLYHRGRTFQTWLADDLLDGQFYQITSSSCTEVIWLLFFPWYLPPWIHLKMVVVSTLVNLLLKWQTFIFSFVSPLFGHPSLCWWHEEWYLRINHLKMAEQRHLMSDDRIANFSGGNHVYKMKLCILGTFCICYS